MTKNILKMNKSVGKKLKELRVTRGISLEQLMDELNISKSTYLRMEEGETSSWTNKIDAICKFYNIEPEELLLSKDKLIIISKHQQNGTITGNVVNNLSEKVIELYERLLKDKDNEIFNLKQISKE